MTRVEVDDDVMTALVREIHAFGETPNSVLRRVLGIDPGGAPPSIASIPGSRPPQSRGPRRVAIGRTQEREFQRPILESLIELGGRGSVEDVLARVEAKMKGALTQVDYQTIRSGQIRWRNTAMFQRKAMLGAGQLKLGSPHGVWEISEQGRHLATQATENLTQP